MSASLTHAPLTPDAPPLVLVPTLRCGGADPDPVIDQRLATARRLHGDPAGFHGCGQPVVVLDAFRCLTCSRWMHQECLREHYGWSRHDHDQTVDITAYGRWVRFTGYIRYLVRWRRRAAVRRRLFSLIGLER